MCSAYAVRVSQNTLLSENCEYDQPKHADGQPSERVTRAQGTLCECERKYHVSGEHELRARTAQ
jgi:hypothetical protein